MGSSFIRSAVGFESHPRCAVAKGIHKYTYIKKKICKDGTSLVAQWIGLCAPIAGGPGSHVVRDACGQGSHMHAAIKSSHATTKKPACRN